MLFASFEHPFMANLTINKSGIKGLLREPRFR